MSGGEKNFTKKIVLLKTETTEGTDAVPTTAANALKVLNLQPTFMDADFKTRNIEVPYFGAKPSIPAQLKRGGTFDMEMTGSGTAGTAPGWMTAARAASFSAPVIVATTSATITPITDNIPSVSMYQYIDDLLLAAIGARATMGFTIEDDEIPIFTFGYLGRAPTSLASQAAPTNPTITGYPDPVLASTENTSILLDAYALGVRRLTMNNNADLQYRSLINPVDKMKFAGRGWAGELVAQVPDLTVKDYFAKIRPGTTMPAAITHGNVAGNIIQINMPALQISGNVTFSEEQGVLMMTMPVTALPVSGNDEVVFIAT